MPDSRALKWVRRCGFALLGFSACLWLFTTICFVGVWDHVAAITTFPQWCWAFVGVVAAALAWRALRRRTRAPLGLLILWLTTTIYFADNLLPLLRGVVYGSRPEPKPASEVFRVVTLNCASSADAATEVMQFRPDLVLLQESPTSNRLAALTQEWFGERGVFVTGLDCAIVSAHPVKPLASHAATTHYTRAIVQLAPGQELLVTSLRLTPPLGSMDLWQPATWRAYLEDRRLRKRQLRSTIEAPVSLPEIIGGDFNAPAGDGIYRLLRTYRDAHRIAGRSWGNTALNTIPLFRPDQIWLSRLKPIASYAVRTVHSDHRMVIVDIEMKALLPTEAQTNSIKHD